MKAMIGKAFSGLISPINEQNNPMEAINGTFRVLDKVKAPLHKEGDPVYIDCYLIVDLATKRIWRIPVSELSGTLLFI